MVGTGPFLLTRFVEGSSSTYQRNPDYWDRETIGGKAYAIPFVDQVIYRTIKDAATQQTALRTGKIDILEIVPWLAVDYLKQTTPELQWTRYLGSTGAVPRRCASTASRSTTCGCGARSTWRSTSGRSSSTTTAATPSCSATPCTPTSTGYFQPLEAMPASVKELFTYDPVKAKKLLAEAGFPTASASRCSSPPSTTTTPTCCR